MDEEQIFVEKAKRVSFAIIKTIENETSSEPEDMVAKISLLALTKVSASVLHMLQKMNGEDDEILDLFIGTLIESIKALDGLATAGDQTRDVINKVMRKP